MSDAANADQIAYWNGAAGETWTAIQDRMDRQLEGIGQVGIAALAPKAGERLLDVGCGCGATSLALARAVGADGAVTGLDISAPMLARARTRAAEAGLANLRFEEADAQTDRFAPGAYDGIFSRFGVMFFADPAAAFANMRRGLKPGGRLAFVCWRAMAENPFMVLPMMAATPHLPPSPPPVPGAPGPFAFADQDRVRGVLNDAGFQDIGFAQHDEHIGAGDLDESVSVALRVGPLAAAIRENPDRREVVTRAIREAMAPHVTPAGVRLASAVWVVTATSA
jgi:SAM-dependent methyltransferase